jgi:hypothetical protein
MTTSSATKPVSAVLGWFATTPATENAIIDMANSRQIALRTRLRHHYWLTDCKPIGPVTLATIRRKMALIDQRDEMTDPEVTELLSSHYGFEKAPVETDSGPAWIIPDLLEARGVATSSITEMRERMSGLGKASAAKRGTGKAASGAGPQGPTRAPERIDQSTAEVAASATDDADF